jgi:hypothetical protein
MQKLAYTYEEAGAQFGHSAAFVEKLVRDGVLTPVYPSSRPVITHEELEAYIASLPIEKPTRRT